MSTLNWVPAESSDDQHPDEEVDLEAIERPGDASWAHVAAEGDHFEWYVYRHWMWEQIDNDPRGLLASGRTTSMAEGKTAVEKWVQDHRKSNVCADCSREIVLIDDRWEDYTSSDPAFCGAGETPVHRPA